MSPAPVDSLAVMVTDNSRDNCNGKAIKTGINQDQLEKMPTIQDECRQNKV